MKIKKSSMIHTYAQSMGVEAAKKLITKKIKSAALEEKELYTEEETAKIYGNLIKDGGSISTVAQNLVVQLERKRSEEQTLLLDNIENQIWYLTDEKTYGIVNKAHAEFIGLEKKELKGRDLHDIICEEDAYVCISNNREVFKKKKQSHIEEWIKDGRGERRLLSIKRTPKLDIKGDVEYVICAAEDVTERKRAEEALQKSEEKFRLLAENSIDCIWILDKRLRFIYLSPSSERIMGFKPEQWIGTSLSSHFKKKEFLKVGTLALKVLKNHKTFTDVTFETKMLNSKNEEVNVEISSKVLLNSQGKLIGLQGITRDITERKQAEAELRKLNEELEQRVNERTAELEEKNKELKFANERLLELDHMKSMFIASTSHELRTPLNSIIGFSSILLEGWMGDLDPEQKEQLQLIHAAGKQLLDLINDIIDISKIEAGKLETDIQEFELKELIDEAVSLVKNDIDEKGLDLKMEVEDMTIVSDRRRLLQCLINLMSNAVKFTDKGMITLHAKNINNMTNISIEDTGTGIMPDDIPKLFAPFMRLESSLSAKTQGTGLGLYLTKKLTEDVLGGKVKVTSEYGTGSTFMLDIPVKLEIRNKEVEFK